MASDGHFLLLTGGTWWSTAAFGVVYFCLDNPGFWIFQLRGGFPDIIGVAPSSHPVVMDKVLVQLSTPQFSSWITGWWFGTMEFYDFPHNYWECHHPNWRTPSFFRGAGLGIPPSSIACWSHGDWLRDLGIPMGIPSHHATAGSLWPMWETPVRFWASIHPEGSGWSES